MAKRIRPHVQVEGKFRHLLNEIDRPDQLANKYYREPRKWWRICDANPQFMSPQALFGKDAITEARIAVSGSGASPPWSVVLAAISVRIGVESVRLERSWSLDTQRRTIGGQDVDVNVERSADVVFISYNRLNLELSAIAGLLEGFGFLVNQPQITGRTGKAIVIPPDTSAPGR